jgi:hypothetical protein
MLSEGHGIVHYSSCDFTYDGKEKSEFVKWTEKNINKEICIYLQRHLLSKLVHLSDVVHVQVVAGGNHGNTAFQFGASVSVELASNCIIELEVSVCKLICRKDTGCLLEQRILPRLTDGLEILATFKLHIFKDDVCGVLVAEYCRHTGQIQNATPSHIPTTKVFVMGDWPSTMALGKESMAGHWCMQYKATQLQFNDDCKLWTMDKLVRCGKDAETKNGDLLHGVKKAMVAVHTFGPVHGPPP